MTVKKVKSASKPGGNSSGKRPRKRPYEARTDLEKIRSQWKKSTGLHTREEPSAAIIRAATAAEIAVNFAVRTEFERNSTFDPAIVDKLLMLANGFQTQLDRLLNPLVADPTFKAQLRRLKSLCSAINSNRNPIVHSGAFSTQNTAEKVIDDAREFIETLIGHYEPGFRLPL